MKKRLLFIIPTLFLVGCATNTPTPKPQPKIDDKKISIIKNFLKKDTNVSNKNDVKEIAKYTDKIVNTNEAKKVLLKTNPIFAKKYKKEALKEKINLKPNSPLYIPPRFAEMTIFPYVSDDKIYHDTQIVWIRIKQGEFVLSQDKKKMNERVFNPLNNK